MPRNVIETLGVRRRRLSLSPRAAVRLAVAVGLLILALLLIRTLAQSHLRRTATNDVPATEQLALAPGATHCQPDELVPPGTGSVTFPAQAATAAPARVRVTAAGTTGTTALTPAFSYVFLRLAPVVRADRRGSTVCFKNEGATPLALFGAAAPGAPVPPPPDAVRVRLDWFRAAPQRNWTMGSTVAARYPLDKAPFLGPWTFWAVGLLVVALSAAALLWGTRQSPE